MGTAITILLAIAGGIFWLAAERPNAFNRFVIVARPVSYWGMTLIAVFLLGRTFGKLISEDGLTLNILVGGESVGIVVWLTIIFCEAVRPHDKS